MIDRVSVLPGRGGKKVQVRTCRLGQISFEADDGAAGSVHPVGSYILPSNWVLTTK